MGRRVFDPLYRCRPIETIRSEPPLYLLTYDQQCIDRAWVHPLPLPRLSSVLGDLEPPSFD